ncbi:MAG: MFS transporter [Actinomycetota bacterium]
MKSRIDAANPSTNGDRRKRAHVGIAFHHPSAFWLGTFAIMAGVLLHLPDFIDQSGVQFRLEGMSFSGPMQFGTGLIVVGITLAAFGLFPRKDQLGGAKTAHGYRLKAMDDAPLTGAHYGLLFVLGVALIVDVMKPASLGFSVPGMKAEYGLSTAAVSLLPLSALTGTTIGSFLWGIWSDRLGRRAAILLASLMFMGTAICGFMPSFRFNLFMCFFMGLAAGGMLPIVYALMAESIPAKKRGWLVVLHGGMGTVGGYLAASAIAAWLVPHFSWRILWFMNLPTGALFAAPEPMDPGVAAVPARAGEGGGGRQCDGPLRRDHRAG